MSGRIISMAFASVRITFLSYFSDQVLDEAENKKLTAFERAGMENYLHRRHKVSREHIDVKVSTAGER